MARPIFCIAILLCFSSPSFAEVNYISSPADNAKWAERAISQKSREWLKGLDEKLQNPVYKADPVAITVKIAKNNEYQAVSENEAVAETYTLPGKDVSLSAVNTLPAAAEGSKDIDISKTGDGWAERAITKKSRKWLEKVNDELSLHTSGIASNEIAYRISSPERITKIKNQLILSETGKLSENARFKVSGRGYWDAVYDFTTTYGRNVRSDQGSEIEFRDTYIDCSIGPMDLRLGNQQVVWGEALALFFADVVNARDLREFILPDFDMIRVPQWGIDAEFSHSNFHAELVWLPFLKFDKLPVSGSEFYYSPPVPTVTTPFYAYDPPEVPSTFANSNIGGRLSYLYDSGLDVSVFYYHTWTHSPVYFRTIVNNAAYLYYPEYRRLDMIGATFAKEIEGMVFKGELVLNKDDYLPVSDVTDSDGILRRDDLNYLLGFDYTFHGGVETNLQFMQRVVFNYTDTLINEKAVANSLAFRIAKSFMDGKLEPEILMVTNLGNFDMMLRPKCVYKMTGDWRLRFGMDIFLGTDPMGLFSKYNNRSRIYLETAYHF